MAANCFAWLVAAGGLTTGVGWAKLILGINFGRRWAGRDRYAGGEKRCGVLGLFSG